MCARGKRELSFALFVSFCSFPVTDVPALVRCRCRYGATSPASQNPENPPKEYSAEVRQVSAHETHFATLTVRIDEVRNHLGQVGARILPWAQPDYCKPHSGKLCRTRSRDTDGKRQLDFEHGAPTNLCFVFTLLLMKTVILWKTR